MHSKAYEEAKKEFINCLALSLIGLGVPIYNAFHYWRPIMKAELAKERLAAESGEADDEGAAAENA